MKVTLFMLDKLNTFFLPVEVSGSFSFDINVDEENKLINIKEKNGQWFIYSTDAVQVLNGNSYVEDIVLQEYSFYVIRREGVYYLIYVSPIYELDCIAYTYNNSNLIIGNQNDCNIKYNCPYQAQLRIEIKNENNMLLLTKDQNTILYVNKIILKENSYYIKNGDTLDLYGLRLTFLPNMIIINNPNNRVMIDDIITGLSKIIIDKDENYNQEEVKNKDLYDENSYFSKSPRIRRTIETKTIKIDTPPTDGQSGELPLILTIGPMLTMAIVSFTMLMRTISQITSGKSSMSESWPTLVSGIAMLVSTLVWPIITKQYNKILREKKTKQLIEKYDIYLKEKETELINEQKLQKDILMENLISITDCLNVIKRRNLFFWDKRIEQNDFLVVRIGVGNAKLDIDIQYPEKGFSIDESELKKRADQTVERFKYIENVPIAYSLSKNKITAVMGDKTKSMYFVDNIILQLITFYSYDDLKLVLFTNEENKSHWKYLKYLNHTFDNSKNIRFFCSNTEDIKRVTEYLEYELANRINEEKASLHKPHYLLIVDDYNEVKKTQFMKQITEIDESFGFSIIILEKSLTKLPSKCVNFIQLSEKKSGLMENSYEKQECIYFFDEINYNINMLEVSKLLSNTPIEFENSIKGLPESINFMEMEKVGKVEQLNVLNRWNTNDATESLKAEVGVDEDGDYMYLDLHEKFHGPHGLIAGTTGSGKSEFIITYILSLAINYSPDDVAFILIDYKGGGLSSAFENKTAGIYLPHLAGTITNLDKAEMDRTLVSIDSEVKKRQQQFNDAKEKLGESTLDIYKYQKRYKEGKLDEPIPHLFIICDEFAELKSQQPDFMDNLISVARIGRSLGVHLILATQKPSGVVNDQIWSNSKFKVCLKVQDAADSKEMIKRPDAANLKQAGRFYLQVGYDEYFALGQSAWCGAKYYPSEKIIKEVDKSINFINNTGDIIKSIKSGNSIKQEAQGEQLANILNVVIEVSKQVDKKAKRLWLPNIDPIILVDDLIKKYAYKLKELPEAIIGEYDAPEIQEQGLLTYNFVNQGNTLIYGNDSTEREMVLSSIIYSTSILYKTDKINYYIYDFGSESLRKFSVMPQVGDIVFTGEDEKVKNLFKLIKNEMSKRKHLLADYGGEYINYINSQNKGENLPVISIIINNFESFIELYPTMGDDLVPIARDCARYGIIFIVTLGSMASMGRRLRQNFENSYALKISDPSDYMTIFNSRKKIIPRDITGRGLFLSDNVHEFQTASLLNDSTNEIEKLKTLAQQLQKINSIKVPKIPSLPVCVTYQMIEKNIQLVNSIPIGISREELEIMLYDFTAYPATIITSNKLININSFMEDLITVMSKIQKLSLIIIDPYKYLEKMKQSSILYVSDNYDEAFDKLINYTKSLNEKKEDKKTFCIMYGAEKLKTKLTDPKKIEEFTTLVKTSDYINLIISDDAKKLKALDYDNWYSSIRNNTDGIWVGKGISDQAIFKVSNMNKEMTKEYKNNYAYCITESSSILIKLIDFESRITEEDENEE